MSPEVTYADGSTPSVCIVGAGMAGLCAAIQLKRVLGIKNFVLFDRAHDVGGTWLANIYPGCQADAPAVLYSYSFAMYAGWSKVCPDRDEVWAYLHRTAAKFGIYAHARFNTAVDTMRWNQDSTTWTVTTTNIWSNETELHEFSAVIIATGLFREPMYPPEFAGFSGPVMHSARWDSNVRLENQVVGVVGNGSSAVQVIPAIAHKVRKMVVYVREPNHMIWKFQWRRSALTKLICRLVPCLLFLFRALFFLGVDIVITPIYESGSIFNKAGEVVTRMRLWRNVKNKHVRELLTPRRPTGFIPPTLASATYYRAYNRPNVELNASPVTQVMGKYVTTEDGRVDRLDVLVLCTGFKLQDFFAPIRVTAADGADLLQLWKTSRPETYYSVTCHAAPNLFFLLGPNGGCFRGTNVFMLECQVQLVTNALCHMMRTNSASVRVTRPAQAQSMLEITRAMRAKTYMQTERTQGLGRSASWFLNEHGFATAAWPKTCTCFWLRTRRLNPTHFHFTPRHSNTMTSKDHTQIGIEETVV